MAIVEAAQKIPATVGAISKLQSNDYGEYRSVLFEGAGLENGKLWRKMPPEQAERFQRGDAVNLIPTSKKGKPGWDIERLSGAAAPPAAAVHQTQGHAAPADAEAAFNQLLTCGSSRMDRALSAAMMVANRKLGITAAQVQGDLAAAAIVKELGVSLFIEAHRAMTR